MQISRNAIGVIIIAFIVSLGVLQYFAFNHFEKIQSIYSPDEMSILLEEVQENLSMQYSTVSDGAAKDKLIVLSASLQKKRLLYEEISLLYDEIQLYTAVTQLGYPALFLLFVLAVILYYMKTIFKPLKLLVTANNSFINGDKSVFPISISGSSEVGELSNSINTLIETERKQAEQLQRQSAYMGWRHAAREVVHEVSNIVTPMKIAMENIYRSSIQNEHVQTKDTVPLLSCLKDLQSTVNSLKELSRQESIEFTHVDIVEIIESRVALFSKQFPNIHAVISEPVAMVNGDRNLIRASIEHMIYNAIEAVQGLESGKIEIHYCNGAIECKDNGPGVSPEIESRIFTLNYSTKPNNSGLGLYFINKTAEIHGGSVSLIQGINGDGFGIRMDLHE